MQHVHDNLEQYVNRNFTASERRVLLTRWIGDAWEEVSSNKEMIARAFKKCGISVAADGSEDADIHIEGLDDYTVAEESEEDDSDTDPFASDVEEDEAVEKDASDTDPFASDVEDEAMEEYDTDLAGDSGEDEEDNY